MRTYKMPALRTSYQTSAYNIIISLIPLCGGLSSSKRNTHTVLFDLYDESYTMDLEDFCDACKIPQWGLLSEPHKSEYNDFLASITVGETRNITQATIGSIHFPAIHYFALFIGRCLMVNMIIATFAYQILVSSSVQC